VTVIKIDTTLIHVTDEIFMTRCLQLAKLGQGHTAPNPMVGSVVVYEGQIIGEGFHRKYGGAHAEVHAIASVKDKELLSKSILYVNLEPCSHTGKTPPCADLIIDMGIKGVVIGTEDPNPLVAGKGIAKLREAGCEVKIGVLREECLLLNRRFFTFIEHKRPYIFLKWAQSADGFIDTERTQTGQPNWITNENARIAVHKQRATESAILVGTRTAIKDNPSLTLRDWYGQMPLRIVVDRNGSLPESLSIFSSLASTLVISNNRYACQRKVDYIPIVADNVVRSVITYLFHAKVESLIVEGGSETIQHFLDEGLWDEAHVYTGPACFVKGIKAPQINGVLKWNELFDNSTLEVFQPNESEDGFRK
jgi:diaminohydroxyphosphoribosylaminopyrimidine deaminase / 5-amino-6-(5-phosphoribosylamino)uracil reductase